MNRRARERKPQVEEETPFLTLYHFTAIGSVPGIAINGLIAGNFDLGNHGVLNCPQLTTSPLWRDQVWAHNVDVQHADKTQVRLAYKFNLNNPPKPLFKYDELYRRITGEIPPEGTDEWYVFLGMLPFSPETTTLALKVDGNLYLEQNWVQIEQFLANHGIYKPGQGPDNKVIAASAKDVPFVQ